MGEPPPPRYIFENFEVPLLFDFLSHSCWYHTGLWVVTHLCPPAPVWGLGAAHSSSRVLNVVREVWRCYPKSSLCVRGLRKIKK